MFDADRLLSELIGGGLLGGRGGRRRSLAGRDIGPLGGALSRGLGRGLGRAARSPQGLTILGGLAIAAYEHLKEKRAAATPTAPPAGPPSGAGPSPAAAPTPWTPAGGATPGRPEPPVEPPPFPGAAPHHAVGAPGEAGSSPAAAAAPEAAGGPVAHLAGDDRARLLILAMVEAAKADGHVDPAERARILDHLAREGENEEAVRFLEAALDAPPDPDGIAARAADSILAAEVYAASLLVMVRDTPAEEAYLSRLAARMRLDPVVAQALESRLSGAEELPPKGEEERNA